MQSVANVHRRGFLASCGAGAAVAAASWSAVAEDQVDEKQFKKAVKIGMVRKPVCLNDLAFHKPLPDIMFSIRIVGIVLVHREIREFPGDLRVGVPLLREVTPDDYDCSSWFGHDVCSSGSFRVHDPGVGTSGPDNTMGLVLTQPGGYEQGSLSANP